MTGGPTPGLRPERLAVAGGLDVPVAYRPAPDVPADAAAVSVTVQAHGAQRWWRLPSLGTIWTDGTAVIVDAVHGQADADLLHLLLGGPVAAEVIWRSGALPVRGAAAVTRHGRSVLVFGRPAVGTSTLARTLVRRGGTWLGDELLAVVPPRMPGGRATVCGRSPDVALAKDSCARLGITAAERSEMRPGLAHLRSDVPRWRGDLPQPLDSIVHMDASTSTPEATWVRKHDPASTARFLASLAAAAEGSVARNATGSAPEQFRRVCAVATAVRRLDFTRPARDDVRINADARVLEAALR